MIHDTKDKHLAFHEIFFQSFRETTVSFIVGIFIKIMCSFSCVEIVLYVRYFFEKFETSTFIRTGTLNRVLRVLRYVDFIDFSSYVVLLRHSRTK